MSNNKTNMNIPIVGKSNLPTAGLAPNTPLHERAPTRDENGKRLTDFMMFIPKLKTKPPEEIKKMVDEIRKVFKIYEDVIVFADLNLKINVLWVSVKAIPGITVEIPAAIHALVPEAKLVGDYAKSKH